MFGPIVKRAAWAFVSGMPDKFLTHLALDVSGAVVVGSMEAIVVAVGTNVEVLGKPDVWRFEQPLYWLYIYQLSAANGHWTANLFLSWPVIFVFFSCLSGVL